MSDYGSFSCGAHPELHCDEQLPPAGPEALPQGKGASLPHALTAGGLGLHPLRPVPHQPGGKGRHPGSRGGAGTGRICPAPPDHGP